MQKDENANCKAIVFQLQDEEFAIPVEFVGGIERMMHITRVPQTASFVKGVINLRGVVTPIIDLRSRFGMEQLDYNNATRIIIVTVDNKEVGLIVDQANDVMDIPQSSIESAPNVIGSVNADYIEGVAKTGDRLLILLDLQRVLSADNALQTPEVEGQ
ncbi:chemotaxis protein CheW [Virgibacillus sp. 179-BFC.A HS]|uniref:Chemotaxis protein CheW n=1 Tax=Tigheibacillus jepli TaxID=3035914 RepID=A0ABU5CHN9_9BACI|nr:chemotaxis protein CheW [Virgibacillus sp. 179-BFC.A HS]MDY0405868.1 chemotaxis protein CheW [Virgibacillus sp. 179-BFC.A HS]